MVARPSSALVGMCCGVLGSLIIYKRPKISYVLAFIFTVFALSAPWVMKHDMISKNLGAYQDYLATSFQHRIYLWEAMGKVAVKKPIIGHGFDYSTSLSGGEKA